MLHRRGIFAASFALVALVLGLGAAPASAVTVYDNTVTAVGAFSPGTTEHGDEVTLAGTARTVVAFEFLYRLGAGQGDLSFGLLWLFSTDLYCS